ncbi:MAG: DUF4055 domain-containing protein [Gammaproteobacteria bacterium]|nr:DUF4055 domain-containing protein [Gammaproteobacteria bacterium]
MKVNTRHADYTANEANWSLLRDFLRGEDAVKAGGEAYLPKPAGREDAEYAKYVQRATFYDATAKTVDAMTGGIFRKAPTFTLPAAMEYLRKDADGQDTGIAQVAKRVTREVCGMGRVGLLVDFPVAPLVTSRRDEAELKLQAKITHYIAENIINWRYEKVGAEQKLVLLVLREYPEIVDPTDLFVVTSVEQYRVLWIDAGSLVVDVWREKPTEDGKQREWVVHETTAPRLPGGKPLDLIPFVFVGSDDLTASVSKGPVLDIARINLAHYRNSADYEDGLFMLGQPTPWITGLSQQFIDKHKGDLLLGSRSAWLLPESSSVGMLEMTNNMQALKDAMASKETQMAALGARMFDQKDGGVEAAAAIRLRQTGEASTLSSVASNVSQAFTICLELCALWMSANPEETEFKTNDDFFATRLDATSLAELVRSWQAGAITQRTLFQNLLVGEIISDGTDFDDYRDELAEDAASLPDVSSLTDPNTDPDTDPTVEDDPDAAA